jgi:GT2 family glycosyltransferase
MNVLKAKKDQKVCVAFPSRDDRSGRFMDSLITLQSYDAVNSRRIADGGGIIPLPATMIAQARNQIVRTFIHRHTADWLWFVDTDMVFPPDILDRLVASAHPRDRPIMGALCFSVTADFQAAPTIYMLRPDGDIGRVLDYPRNKVIVADATGTGCVLIHRTVFEAMRKAAPPPWEWFVYATMGGEPIGEDITFCLRAQELGIPTHVDTSIKCGHEKPVVIDETLYLTQQMYAGKVPVAL